MPPKKNNCQLFDSLHFNCTSGKSALYVNEHYNILPSVVNDLKKGHVFPLLISNLRHVGSVHNILKTIPGAPDSYYFISKLLASLVKYRKLTNPVEFIRF